MATLGFAGLGNMGKEMAAHLQLLLDSDQAAGLGFAQGSKLLAYNRSPAKAAELAAEVGSAQAESPADLAVCSITFSMLANDAAVEAVLSSFLQGRQAAGDRAPPAALFIDCSTVLPSTTRRLAARAAAHGVGFVACPVFGRPDAAAAAQLIGIVAGGSAEQRERVKALVGAAFAGRRVIDLGGDPGTATACKLTGNFWIASQVEVASQVLTLGEKNGVPPELMASLLEGMTAAGIPMGYTKRIAAGNYSAETGFAAELALKDVGYMRELARESACPAPLADLAFNHLLTCVAKGQGRLDWGAIALSVRDAAGLPPNTQE